MSTAEVIQKLIDEKYRSIDELNDLLDKFEASYKADPVGANVIITYKMYKANLKYYTFLSKLFNITKRIFLFELLEDSNS